MQDAKVNRKKQSQDWLQRKAQTEESQYNAFVEGKLRAKGALQQEYERLCHMKAI